MKRYVQFILTAIICLITIIPNTVEASASAGLTGTSTVRAGDTITLTFNLSGSDIYGVSGALSFDAGQLSLTGTSKQIASPWLVEFNGNRFVAYDNNLTSPINAAKAIFTATFRVNSSLAAGARISVSVVDTVATDGSEDFNVGTVSYSATLAAPLSSNANLSALTVGNATISPSFSPNRTSYTAAVPFEVTSLNISTTTEDSAARVSISGNSLSVGENIVSITVTAASGAKKTYTINVTREQDPNYVPSSNANLESITIDNGILSPKFDPERREYIVYLPYEITTFTAGGVAADAKAQGVEGETTELSVGENKVTVTVTAEDGTKKEYSITVVRMPEFGVPTEPHEPGESNDEESESDENLEELETEGVPTWIAAIMVVSCLGIGIAGYSFVTKRRK